MCVTSAEGAELDSIAQEKGVVLSVYQNRRWDADFLTVKKLLASGKVSGVPSFSPPTRVRDEHEQRMMRKTEEPELTAAWRCRRLPLELRQIPPPPGFACSGRDVERTTGTT